MDTSEDAIQKFHIGMVVPDPLFWLRHAKFRVAARHPFHTHQPDVLSVQVEFSVLDFQFPYSERRRELV
jgi:hypothetical protein